MGGFFSLLLFPGERKMNVVLKDTSKGHIKEKSCGCRGVLRSSDLPLASKGLAAWEQGRELSLEQVFLSPPPALGWLSHAKISYAKKQVCGLRFAPPLSRSDSPSDRSLWLYKYNRSGKRTAKDFTATHRVAIKSGIRCG